MNTSLFGALCIIYWVSIAIMSMRQKAIEYPGVEKGTSLVPYLVMPVIVFGIGLGLNVILNNLGYWVVGITHATYLLYGIAYSLTNKTKKSSQ